MQVKTPTTFGFFRRLGRGTTENQHLRPHGAVHAFQTGSDSVRFGKAYGYYDDDDDYYGSSSSSSSSYSKKKEEKAPRKSLKINPEALSTAVHGIVRNVAQWAGISPGWKEEVDRLDKADESDDDDREETPDASPIITWLTRLNNPAEPIPENRKEPLRKFLTQMLVENNTPDQDFENFFPLLMTMPATDTSWNKLFSAVEEKLKVGEDFPIAQILSTPLSHKQPHSKEWLAQLDKTFTQYAEDDQLQIQLLKHVFSRPETEGFKERKESLVKMVEDLAENPPSASIWNEAKPILQLFAAMPINATRWKAMLEDVQKHLDDDTTFPLRHLMDSHLDQTDPGFSAWLDRVETHVGEKEDPYKELGYPYIAILLARPEDKIPKNRVTAVQKLLMELQKQNFNCDEDDYLGAYYFATLPVEDKIWNGLVKLLQAGLTQADSEKNYINFYEMIYSGRQYLVEKGKLPAQWDKDLDEDVGNATNSEQVNPLVLSKIRLLDGALPVSRNRKVLVDRLLSSAIIKEGSSADPKKQQEDQKEILLFAAMPIPDKEWMALADGLVAYSRKADDLDLLGVMVETLSSLDSTDSKTAPWLVDFAKRLGETKHPYAAVMGQQATLQETLNPLSKLRQDKLQETISDITRHEIELDDNEMQAFKLFATMPVADAEWEKLHKTVAKTLKTQPIFDVDDVMANTVQSMHKAQKSLPAEWLKPLQSHLQEIDHSQSAYLSLILNYATEKSEKQSERSSQMASLLTTASDAGIQLNAADEKALHLLETAPINEVEWQKAHELIQGELKKGSNRLLDRLVHLAASESVTDKDWLNLLKSLSKEKGHPKFAMLEYKASLHNPANELSPARRNALSELTDQLMMVDKPFNPNELQLLKVLADLPGSDKEWLGQVKDLVNKTGKESLEQFLVRTYLFADEDKPSNKAWKNQAMGWFKAVGLDAYLKQVEKSLESIRSTLPLMKAKTPAEVVSHMDEVNSGSVGSGGYDDTDYDDYGGYGGSSKYSKKVKDPVEVLTKAITDAPKVSSGMLDIPLGVWPNPADKKAAAEVIAKYPSMFFTFGFDREELLDLGVTVKDLDILGFQPKPTSPTGSASAGKAPMAAASMMTASSMAVPSAASAIASMSTAALSKTPPKFDSKEAVLAFLPKTLGYLYYKAYHGDEKAFVDMVPRILMSDEALSLLSPMMRKIEGEMDSYASSHYSYSEEERGKGVHPNEAEMMLLFKNPRAQAGDSEVNAMTSAITSIDRFINYGIRVTHRMITDWGELGLLTHGFRFWRYDTQGGPTSLFAKYGGQLIPERPTDKNFQRGYYFSKAVNPKLPIDGKTKMEFRRGYIVVTHPDRGTLLIRNSSLVFGRDQLEHPVYFAHEALSETELKNLDPKNDSRFIPILKPKLYKKKGFLDNMEFLLNEIKAVKADYAKWKFDPEKFNEKEEFIGDVTPGMKQMVDMLETRLAENELGLSNAPLPVLGFTSPEYPPYMPFDYTDSTGQIKRVFEITPESLAELKDRLNGTWSTKKYPHSDWVEFVRTGIDKEAELVLFEPEPDMI